MSSRIMTVKLKFARIMMCVLFLQKERRDSGMLGQFLDRTGNEVEILCGEWMV